jgi:hypothetical protein
MTFEEQSRRRLADWADKERSPLREGDRAAIIARLAADGPRTVRRARIVHTATRVAGGTAAVLISLVGASFLLNRSPSEPTARACEHFETFPGASLSDRRDLGARARFVTAEGSTAKLVEASPCKTTVALASGRVSVHARDLGGGELRVDTPFGSVIVHGTIFSVDLTEDRMVVEVAEGRVEVARHDSESSFLGRGDRLTSTRRGTVARGALEPAQIERLTNELVAEPGLASADQIEEDVEPDEETEREAKAPRKARRDRRDRPSQRATKRSVSTETRRSAPASPAREDEPPEPAPSTEINTGDKPALWPKPERTAPKAEEPKPMSLEEMLRAADLSRKRGELDRARELYRRAGEKEAAAWLRLASLELEAGRGQAARDALRERERRFGSSMLEPEASWIMVRVLELSGKRADARKEAERLVEDHPQTPQAAFAKEWLKEHPER